MPPSRIHQLPVQIAAESGFEGKRACLAAKSFMVLIHTEATKYLNSSYARPLQNEYCKNKAKKQPFLLLFLYIQHFLEKRKIHSS